MASGFILPSKDEFMEVFNLFPKGNPEKAYLEINYSLTMKKKFDGTPLTWVFLSDKYREYIAIKKQTNTDSMYIKSFESFVKSGDYNTDIKMTFSKADKQKDNYFTKGLEKSLEEMQKRLGGNNEGTI